MQNVYIKNQMNNNNVMGEKSASIFTKLHMTLVKTCAELQI